jgi:hypothetical protein
VVRERGREGKRERIIYSALHTSYNTPDFSLLHLLVSELH